MIPDSTTIIKHVNGNIEVIKTGGPITVDPRSVLTKELDGVKATAEDGVLRDFKVIEVKEVIRDDGTIVPIADSQTLFDELKEFFFFSVGGGGVIPSGSMLAEVKIVTLIDGDNVINHGLDKAIIAFSVKFNNEFKATTGVIVDSNNFNVNLSGGGPLNNAIVTFIYIS